MLIAYLILTLFWAFAGAMACASDHEPGGVAFHAVIFVLGLVVLIRQFQG